MGGPLTFKQASQHTLLGLANLGECKSHSSFVSISSHLRWIKNKMDNDEKFCDEGKNSRF